MQIEELAQRGLQYVGWYHSHPTFPVLPSSIDVYNQHAQQVAHSCDRVAGGAAPYVAAIVGPYYEHNAGMQSHMSWFYVENRRQIDFSLDNDPAACLQHMVAKHLDVAMVESTKLAALEVLAAATPLVERYSRYSERPDFCEARSSCCATHCAI
jgi:Prokaryotic homologs of the JAB domain